MIYDEITPQGEGHGTRTQLHERSARPQRQCKQTQRKPFLLPFHETAESVGVGHDDDSFTRPDVWNDVRFPVLHHLERADRTRVNDLGNIENKIVT